MTPDSTQNAGALATIENKLLACTHCGLCLEACPTYVHTGDENDGPRGRIYLMRAVEEGRLDAASTTFARHINRCLGCRACEAACPAGVEYGQLLEAARSEIAAPEAKRKLSTILLRFTLRHLWLHPLRLRFAFTSARIMRDAGLINLLLKTRLARLVSPRLEFALALLQSSSAPRQHESNATSKRRQDAPAQGVVDKDQDARDAKQRVMLFNGCVTEGLFARVNRATRRVLAANGCATSAPREQVCCGALHAHAGDLDGARRLARRNIEAFTEDTKQVATSPIVTNAGGCGAMLVSYAHLLADDAECGERARAFSERVRDVSQQLQVMGIRRGAALPDEASVTYDASCHLLYGQRASEAPLEMLQAISDLRFAPLEGSDVCCGGAGIYNLLQPDLSARVLDEKLAHLQATGAKVLATGNPGCQMQIGAGALLNKISPLRVCHPVELLDESYRRAGFYDES